MPLERLEDEGLEKIPNLKLAQWTFRAGLEKTSEPLRKQLLEKITKCIQDDSKFLFVHFLKVPSNPLHQQLVLDVSYITFRSN